MLTIPVPVAFLVLSLTLVRAIDVPPELVPLRNTPLNLTIRYQNDKDSLTTSRFEFVGATKDVVLDLYRVSNFETPPTWSLVTNDGQQVGLYKTEQPGWEHAFKAVAKTGAAFDEAIATLLRIFFGPFECNHALVRNQYDRVDRADSILDGIVKSSLHINTIAIDGTNERPIIKEECLLNLIRSSNAKKVEITDPLTWNVTDAFYQDSSVKKANQLLLGGIQFNGITDESLNGLSASAVSLGQASAVTSDGLRTFLKTVFDGVHDKRSIEFNPAFQNHAPTEVFKPGQYTVTQESKFKWLVAPLESGKRSATLQYKKAHREGVYKFSLWAV